MASRLVESRDGWVTGLRRPTRNGIVKVLRFVLAEIVRLDHHIADRQR